MKPFNSLSRRGQIGRLRRLALAALNQYGLSVSDVRVLTHWHNTTFRIVTEGGPEYMLRVHAAGHLNRQAIESELNWLHALRQQTDLLVPEPIALPNGQLLTEVEMPEVPEPRFVALFRWLPGRFQRQRLSPAKAYAVGAMTARLHNFVQQYELPAGFSRPTIVGFDLITADAMNAAFARHKAIIDPRVPPVFTAVVNRVMSELEAIGEGSDQYGLIHADIHQHNFLFQGDDMVLIDFDDCGLGHFVYDMGVTLFYRQRYGNYAAERTAYLEGYRAQRDFPVAMEPLIDSCIALRDVLLGLYVLSRSEDHPDARARAEAYLQGVAERNKRSWLRPKNP